MAGHGIHLTQQSTAAPEAVWGVLTNIGGAAETLSGVTAVEMLTPGPYAVGTRWRETRRMFGKEETQEMWVAEVDAPRRTVVRAQDKGVDYVTVFQVEPAGSGSRITMHFDAEQATPGRVARLAWSVLGPLGAKATAKVMRRDLADIAAAAERAS